MNNVAMLIDWENIKARCYESLQTPPDIITLKKIARQYGSLRIARAYANWTEPSGWHVGDVDRLTAQGIEPVFVGTRHWDSRNEKGDLYEKDLVDLRLACDGMELLASHPEISCFVIVSADGALSTLLAKLSAGGKHVVRVAVKNALGKGLPVLGEERVMYDDWIKGFRLTLNSEVKDALARLTAAVQSITASSADNGLHAVKELMRRDKPDFDEETIGFPTFRHLAFLAESRGLIKMDASSAGPAKAYSSDSLKTREGASLPGGDVWREFIQRFDPKKEVTKSAIMSICKRPQIKLDNVTIDDLIDIAIRSDILISMTNTFWNTARDSEDVQAAWVKRFKLNWHDPRVQVAVATTPNRRG